MENLSFFKEKKWLLGALAGAFVILVVGLFSKSQLRIETLERDNASLKNEISVLKNTNLQLKEENSAQKYTLKKSTEMNNLSGKMVTYVNNQVGFSFKYPSEWGEVKTTFDDHLFGDFTKNILIGFAINDPQVKEEGRETGFFDYTHSEASMTEADKGLNKIKEFYIGNVRVRIFRGSGESEPGGNRLSSGLLGALVDLPYSRFHGIAFEAQDSVGVENLEKVLRTIKLTK